MSKKAFDKIAEGLTDAVAIVRGTAKPSTYKIHVPSDIDVKRLRLKLKMTQDEFAHRFGFPVGCIRDYEQGRSKPDSAVRAYLIVIGRDPKAVEKALRAA